VPERPLRIVHISTADLGGGAEKTAWKLHRRYRELGHESILTVGWKVSDDTAVIPIDNSGRSRGWRRVAARVEDSLGLEDRVLPGSHNILDLVGGRPDVIHAHNLHTRYFDLAALPKLAAAAPTILTLQDMWLLTGHCGHSFDCRRWETGCGSCPDLTIYPPIPRDATRTNFRRKARILRREQLSVSASSAWLLELVSRSSLRDHPGRVIPNPVDTAIFRPGDAQEARSALGLPSDRPVLFFPGSMGLQNQFKDPATFLRAFEHLRDLQPIALAFSKNGEEQSETKGLFPLAPTSSEEQMARYYRAADVVVHPSRAETFGMALAEALACSRPVAATRVGGMPEIVEDGDTGFLVPAGDDRALADAIRHLLNEPELRARMGEAGVLRVRERFDLRRIADIWLDWYAELREQRSAAASSS
jgi:glycosyltransferase involved in cell wall biosynthesis